MGHALKRMLVGTSAGRLALAARDTIRLLQAPRIEFGTVVNDQIALHLTVDLCPPEGTFIDIGAHIGSVISEVLFRHPKARVVAVEAIPEKAQALQRKFTGIEVHNVALWDCEGEASFFVDPLQSGCSSLAPRGPNAQVITVPTRRLDTLLTSGPVDVIKLDVEGAELGVLRGATELLARCSPIIMFESGPGVSFDFTKEATFQFFEGHGYALYAPNRLAHTGKGMTLDAFLDSHEYPRRTTNYFALPIEKEAQIREKARALAASKHGGWRHNARQYAPPRGCYTPSPGR